MKLIKEIRRSRFHNSTVLLASLMVAVACGGGSGGGKGPQQGPAPVEEDSEDDNSRRGGSETVPAAGLPRDIDLMTLESVVQDLVPGFKNTATKENVLTGLEESKKVYKDLSFLEYHFTFDPEGNVIREPSNPVIGPGSNCNALRGADLISTRPFTGLDELRIREGIQNGATDEFDENMIIRTQPLPPGALFLWTVTKKRDETDGYNQYQVGRQGDLLVFAWKSIMGKPERRHTALLCAQAADLKSGRIISRCLSSSDPDEGSVENTTRSVVAGKFTLSVTNDRVRSFSGNALDNRSKLDVRQTGPLTAEVRVERPEFLRHYERAFVSTATAEVKYNLIRDRPSQGQTLASCEVVRVIR